MKPSNLKPLGLKPLEINPLKASPHLGAALFYLGIKNAVVLMHGSQGCASFDKVTLTKHFRENIPIMTTALDESGAILGGSEFLKSGVKNIIEKIKPEFIGITSTGLTEVNGEDIGSSIKELKQEVGQFPGVNLGYVSAPDYAGVMEDGYKNAMLSLIKDLAEKMRKNLIVLKDKNRGTNLKVNVFCPFSFTSMDFLELREVFEYFGIFPVMIPDLGTSLDGHLDKNGYLQTTSGGVEFNDIESIFFNDCNIVIGCSLFGLVEPLKNLTGLKTYYFSNISGLKNTDAFFDFLSKLTFAPVPEKYKRQRNQLMDAYLDSHFYFLGKNIAMALGIDLLDEFSAVFNEIDCGLKIGITTKTDQNIKKNIKNMFEIFDEGDIDLLDELTFDTGGIDLLISNSNAKYYAEKLGIPLFKAGFPIIDELGHNFKHFILYKGSANLAYEAGNKLINGV